MEKRVTVERGHTARISELLEAEVKPGHLYVSTIPLGAVVKVLNIKPKFFQGMALSPGKYHLSVSRAGYESKKEWITLMTGQEYTAEGPIRWPKPLCLGGPCVVIKWRKPLVLPVNALLR